MKTLAYLAVPYSHPERSIRLGRFEAANRAAAKLMRFGEHVFSPISHAHSIAEAGDLPLGWDFWAAYDRSILACCRLIYVLQLDGWDRSVGIRAELAIAEEMGLPVVYLPEGFA